MVPCPAPRSPLTDVVHDEPLPLPEDEPSGVRVELDGEVRAGGVELLGAAAADVLPQDAGGELVPIVNGEDVAVGEVQAGKQSSVSLGGWSAARSGAGPRGSEVTPMPPTPLPRAPCPQGVSSPAPPAAAPPPAPCPAPCCGCWGGSEPSPRHPKPGVHAPGELPGAPRSSGCSRQPPGSGTGSVGLGGGPRRAAGQGQPPEGASRGAPRPCPRRQQGAVRGRAAAAAGGAAGRVRGEHREKGHGERAGGGREGQGRAGREGGRTGKQRALLLSQQRSAGRIPRACSRDGAVPSCPPKQEGTNGTGTGDKRHWQGQKGFLLSPQQRARESPAPRCPAPSCRPAGLTSSGGAPGTRLMEGQGLGHLVLPFPRSRCPHPTGDISKETSPPAKPGLLPPAGSHLHLLSTHGLGCVRSLQDPCPAHPSA